MEKDLTTGNITQLIRFTIPRPWQYLSTDV